MELETGLNFGGYVAVAVGRGRALGLDLADVFLRLGFLSDVHGARRETGAVRNARPSRG